MKVFVTGATSGLGWGVVPELKAAGHDVVGLTSRPEGVATVEQRGARAVQGDMRQPASWIEHAKAADAVIHMAEILPPKRLNKARLDALASADTICTKAILDAARPDQIIIYTSGAFIYGHCDKPATEDQPLRPHTMVEFKAANDKLVLEAGKAGRAKTMTARLGAV